MNRACNYGCEEAVSVGMAHHSDLPCVKPQRLCFGSLIAPLSQHEVFVMYEASVMHHGFQEQYNSGVSGPKRSFLLVRPI